MKETTPHGEDDSKLDALLRKLHAATPEQGLEDRVLARLRAHTAAQEQKQVWPLFWRGGWLGWAIAAPVCALLLLAVGSRVRRRPPATATSASVERSIQARPAMPPASLAAGATVSPAGGGTLNAPQERFVRSPLGAQAALAHTASPLERRSTPQTARLSAAEQLAMEETRAPSRPAAELPLTAEERHLRRVVQQTERVELAVLLPQQRDPSGRRESAEFEQFFEPAPIVPEHASQGDPNDSPNQ